MNPPTRRCVAIYWSIAIAVVLLALGCAEGSSSGDDNDPYSTAELSHLVSILDGSGDGKSETGVLPTPQKKKKRIKVKVLPGPVVTESSLFNSIDRSDDDVSNIGVLQEIAPPSQQDLVTQLSLLNSLLSSLDSNVTTTTTTPGTTTTTTTTESNQSSEIVEKIKEMEASLKLLNSMVSKNIDATTTKGPTSVRQAPSPPSETEASKALADFLQQASQVHNQDKLNVNTANLQEAVEASNQISSLSALLGSISSIAQQHPELVFPDVAQHPNNANSPSVADLISALEGSQQKQQDTRSTSPFSFGNLWSKGAYGSGLIGSVGSGLGTLGSSIFSSVVDIFSGKTAAGKPRVRGMDTRVGLGYRFGEAADAQVMWDVGPQLFTESIQNEVRAPPPMLRKNSIKAPTPVLDSAKDALIKSLITTPLDRLTDSIFAAKRLLKSAPKEDEEPKKEKKPLSLLDMWNVGKMQKDDAPPPPHPQLEIPDQLLSPPPLPGLNEADVAQMARMKSFRKRSSSSLKNYYDKPLDDPFAGHSTLTEYERMLVNQGSDLGIDFQSEGPKRRRRPRPPVPPPSITVAPLPSSIIDEENFKFPDTEYGTEMVSKPSHKKRKKSLRGLIEKLKRKRRPSKPLDSDKHKWKPRESQEEEGLIEDQEYLYEEGAELAEEEEPLEEEKGRLEEEEEYLGEEINVKRTKASSSERFKKQRRRPLRSRQRQREQEVAYSEDNYDDADENLPGYPGEEADYGPKERPYEDGSEDYGPKDPPPKKPKKHKQRVREKPNYNSGRRQMNPLTKIWKYWMTPRGNRRKSTKPPLEEAEVLDEYEEEPYERFTYKQPPKMKTKPRPEEDRFNVRNKRRRDQRRRNYYADRRFYKKMSPLDFWMNRGKPKVQVAHKKMSNVVHVPSQSFSAPELNAEANDSFLRRNKLGSKPQNKQPVMSHFTEVNETSPMMEESQGAPVVALPTSSSVMAFVKHYLSSKSKVKHQSPQPPSHHPPKRVSSGLSSVTQLLNNPSALNPLRILPFRRNKRPPAHPTTNSKNLPKLAIVDGKLQLVNVTATTTTPSPMVHVGEDMSLEELSQVLAAVKKGKKKKLKLKVKLPSPVPSAERREDDDNAETDRKDDNVLLDEEDYDENDGLKGIFIDIESGEVGVLKPVAELTSFEPKKEEEAEDDDTASESSDPEVAQEDTDGDGISDAEMRRKEEIFGEIQAELKRNYDKMKKAHERSESKAKRKEALVSKGLDASVDVVSKYFDLLPQEEEEDGQFMKRMLSSYSTLPTNTTNLTKLNEELEGA